MYKFILTQSGGNYEVYVNLISSSAGHYLSRRPYIITLIKEVLASLDLRGDRVIVERDMGRAIGSTDIITTSDKDTIYYAQPIKNEVFSRFARNRYPESSQVLTIVVVRDADGDYEVQDTWIGNASPPFPGDEHETMDSKTYWQKHALVQDAQPIQSKSITRICPY
ncbi:MAG: hypothetical protein ACREHG_00800 [Candidatus Saccharimonadales bacterium]